jgi:hypothetical protein
MGTYCSNAEDRPILEELSKTRLKTNHPKKKKKGKGCGKEVL